MRLAIIYSKGSQECQRMLALLQSLDEPFIEYILDRDFSQKQFDAEFGKSASYPQIAIGTEHVGTLKDALHYYQERNML